MHARVVDRLAQVVVVGDAAAYGLVAKPEVAVQAVGRRADPFRMVAHRVVANDRVFDVLDDLLPGDGLDVVGVDVAQVPVLEPALAGVALGMLQHVARVGVDVDLLHRRGLRSDGAMHVHGAPPF